MTPRPPGERIDLDLAVATALAAVQAAGRVIRPLFRARNLVTETKPDRSPVTIADRQAEAAMRDAIARLAPGDAVLGEEGGLDTSGGAASSGRRCWVLDPIDGTRAFVTGRPSFGTLVALLLDGVPVVGVIDQPITGERWIGVAGAPTRFENTRGQSLGGTIGVRDCPALAAAELSATTPAMFTDGAFTAFSALAAAAGRTSWGGDCYAYGLLALGAIDIVCEASMRIWDWAALVPVVEGAGGAITDWQGRPLCGEAPSRVLAVGDPRLQAQAIERLQGRARTDV